VLAGKGEGERDVFRKKTGKGETVLPGVAAVDAKVGCVCCVTLACTGFNFARIDEEDDANEEDDVVIADAEEDDEDEEDEEDEVEATVVCAPFIVCETDADDARGLTGAVVVGVPPPPFCLFFLASSMLRMMSFSTCCFCVP
jgi:hypothetical protein